MNSPTESSPKTPKEGEFWWIRDSNYYTTDLHIGRVTGYNAETNEYAIAWPLGGTVSVKGSRLFDTATPDLTTRLRFYFFAD